MQDFNLEHRLWLIRGTRKQHILQHCLSAGGSLDTIRLTLQAFQVVFLWIHDWSACTQRNGAEHCPYHAAYGHSRNIGSPLSAELRRPSNPDHRAAHTQSAGHTDD
jgi:hypothetical protein